MNKNKISKIKFTLTINNNDGWPRVNRNGETVGNYVEWSDAVLVDEEGNEHDIDDSIAERIEKYCSQMTKGGLGYFTPGETLRQEMDV